MKSSSRHAVVALLALTIIIAVGYLIGPFQPYSDGRTTTEPSAAGANRLNSGLRLGPWHCEIVPLTMNVDGQRHFVETALRCLEQIWLPVLRAENLYRDGVPPVQLVLVEAEMPACQGRGEIARPTGSAFYCSGTIYWPTSDETRQHMGWRDWDLYLFMVMHEYAHHLQSVSGITALADRHRMGEAANTPAGQLTSRRLELQAQCLAGISTAAAERGGAISPNAAARMISAQGNLREEPVHGTKASNIHWSEAGYTDGSTASCNTWIAEPSDVD